MPSSSRWAVDTILERGYALATIYYGDIDPDYDLTNDVLSLGQDRYWRREVWDGRLRPNLHRLADAGRYGNFARGLAWAIHSNYIKGYKPEGCAQYYTDADFDRTDLAGVRCEGEVGGAVHVVRECRVRRLVADRNGDGVPVGLGRDFPLRALRNACPG